MLSTTNAVSSNQFITDIEDFDFSAFKSFDYCFVLEYHTLSSILRHHFNWNEASIGSHILNSRVQHFDRIFEHSLALI